MTENKLGLTNVRKRDTSYKKKPIVTNSFEPTNSELLSNIDKINKTEELAKVNKSIVIPSNVWCDFHAVLHISDNDYSYELLEEMLQSFKNKNNLNSNDKYLKRLERLEEDEMEKIEKKKKK